jgi:sialate O-acetylesterase
MVLQKGESVPVWGRAEPGEKVLVSLDGRKAEATADPGGRWRVNLQSSGPGPFEMTIEAGNRIVISDVVVGEVWLAVGQSNMAFGLEKSSEAATEIPASADPLLREFKVAFNPKANPAAEYQGRWVAAGPATSGRFSAVAYYFGKTLRKEVGRPVGVITSAMSSTPIETWMSGEALDGDPDLKATKDRHWSMRETGPVEGKKMPIPSQMDAALFQAMIQPLIPYGIRGFLWNQGESNAKRGWQYRTALSLMIADWRKKWERGDLPFYLCQAANFSAPAETQGESAWAELRESQAAALGLPNTGIAVLIDTEPGGDLHPRNKKDAGGRLALLALSRDYGKKIPALGPVVRSTAIEQDKVRVSFDQAEGLVLRGDGGTKSFAICGEDRRWLWAEARVEGQDVILRADAVPKPLAVRYAWADNPSASLFNGAGLPAAPFRTDDFPVTSQKGKY